MREILFKAKRIDNGEWVEGCYPMCRKTLCFSYGDIRRVHRIYASN